MPKRTPTYRKIEECPRCGVVVKVPQGQTFEQSHQCDPRPRVRRTAGNAE